MRSRVSSSLRSELDGAAEIVEASPQPEDGLGAVATGKVIGTEIAVLDAVFLSTCPTAASTEAAMERMAFLPSRRGARRRRSWACR
jgi:hypothetical protein